jgi:hypothetical protein
MLGTVQLRLKPQLAAAEFRASAGGQQIRVDEILTSWALYLKTPGLSRRLGKPWMAVPLSALSGKSASAVRQLFQSLEDSNPVTETRVLATTKNARTVGTQVIDGVRTTHYQGSVPASAAFAALPASLRKLIRPAARLVTGNIRFDVWIDAQHQVRKAAEIETIAGQTVATTITITSVNQPVHVTLPPASQVATP